MEATTTSSSSPNNADVDLQGSSSEQAAPPASWRNDHKRRIILSKQLSMCEAPRNIAWERRRRQFFDRRKINLTDDDLKELKGCIELGFGFNQKNGQQLCTTIPALDLYFEVTRRKLSICSPNSNSSSPVSSTGSAQSPGGTIPSPGAQALQAGLLESPLGNSAESKWKIFSPGDDPQQVKTKLRHWAQAVACSVMQSPSTEKQSDMER